MKKLKSRPSPSATAWSLVFIPPPLVRPIRRPRSPHMGIGQSSACAGCRAGVSRLPRRRIVHRLQECHNRSMDGVADLHRRALLSGAVLIAGFTLLMILLPAPKLLPIPTLSGQYNNSCCAPVELLNGRIIVNGQQRPFKVEFDEIGLYVPPDRHVCIQEGRRLTGGGGFPLKLRVDDARQPSSIQLWDVDGSTTYDFVKAAPAKSHATRS